jgi:large conductance mechanosensitive channel
MVGDFRAFLLRTNALALAIGVIIGTALSGIVNSLVNDILMPPIGFLLGGVDFSAFKIVLKRLRRAPISRRRSRSATAR